jgi:hypothetical protein
MKALALLLRVDKNNGCFSFLVLSLYRLPWQRMREMLAFIRYVRERGGQVLDAAFGKKCFEL